MREAFEKTKLTQGQLIKQALNIKDAGVYALISPDSLPETDRWGLIADVQNYLPVKIEPGNFEIITKWIVEWVRSKDNFCNHDNDYISLHYVDDLIADEGFLPIFLWCENKWDTLKSDAELSEEIINLFQCDFNIRKLAPHLKTQLDLAL